MANFFIYHVAFRGFGTAEVLASNDKDAEKAAMDGKYLNGKTPEEMGLTIERVTKVQQIELPKFLWWQT